MRKFYLLSVLFIVAAVLDAEGQSFIVGDDNAVMRNSSEKITRYTEIKGVVIDSLTSEPLRDVLVSILAPEMAVRHAGTDSKGRFRFTDVKAEGLKIEITCLGYKIYAAYPESSGRILDMGKIRLGPDPQQIDQITVQARMSFFTIRGDTVVFNPKSVRTLQGDMAADILRKMPGVKIEGDQIQVMGENVVRTYVNGRPIYGPEGNTAVNYVEASNVAAIKAYDEIDMREYDRTGRIKRKKVLNILTFDLFSQNLTADAFVSYGADTRKDYEGRLRERYAGGGNLRFFSEQQTLSLDASVTNTGFDHLPMSVSAASILTLNTLQPGYSRQTTAGTSYRYSRPMEEVKITLEDGTETVQNRFGDTYRFSYRYDDMFNSQFSASRRDYFPSAAVLSRIEGDTSRRRSLSRSHVAAVSGSFARFPISDFSVELRTKDGESHRLARTWSEADGTLLNRSQTDSRSASSQYSLNAKTSFFIPVRSSKGHPTLRGNASFSYGDSDPSGIQTDTLLTSDHRVVLTTSGSDKDLTASGDLAYMFRVNRKIGMTLQYGVSYQNTESSSLVADPFSGAIDTTLTHDYTVNETRHGFSLRWDHRVSDKVRYTFDFSPDWSVNHRNERFPSSQPDNRHFFLPNLSVQLYLGETSNFSLYYNLHSIAPQLTDLRDRLDTRFPLSLKAGNPELKQSYTHNIAIWYYSTNVETQSSYSVSLEADLYRNESTIRQTYYTDSVYLPQYRYWVQPGATLTDQTNINGAYSLRLKADYSAPANFIKSQFTSSLEIGHGRTPDILNGRLGFVRDFTPQLTLGLASNFSSKIEVNLKTLTGYRLSKSTENDTDHAIRETLDVGLRCNPTPKIFINSTYQFHFFRSSLQPSALTHNHIWNATVGCRVFKKNTGNISVTVYDILNRNSDLTAGMTSSYVFRTWQQLFSRFFTVNVSLRLNRKK